MDGGIPTRLYRNDPVALYGTAKRVKRKRRAEKVKRFFLKGCCTARSCTSDSEQTSVSKASTRKVVSECTEDYNRDTYLQTLAIDAGHHPVISYEHVNVTVREDDDVPSETSVKGESSQTSLALLHQTPPAILNEAERSLPDQSNQSTVWKTTSQETLKKSSVSIKVIISSDQSFENNTSSQMDEGASSGKGIQGRNTPLFSTHNRTVEDVKSAVQHVNMQCHQTFQHGKSKISRQPLRERTSLYFSNSQRSMIKHLLDVRYSDRQLQEQLLIQMMSEMDGQVFSPRYADREERKRTLRNCSETRLRGYRQEDLAAAGWYFNGRILMTFCCGMEMPVTPDGTPQTIHHGLSPHCRFALSLRNSAPGATNGEIRRAEISQNHPDSERGAEISFKSPVQATDDVNGYSEYTFTPSASSPQASFQESVPGNQWTTDETGTAGVQPSEAAYLENVVTNRTPTASEQWQPYSENPETAGAETQGGATENSEQEAPMQLSVRSIASSGMGSTRLLRELENPPPARSNSPPFDQLNILSLDDVYEGERPRYPNFGFPSVRMLTYEGWPSTHTQTPSRLSDAGFFYAGYGDSVLCYACGIGVRYWQPIDDVWVEHTRWRPTCIFVRTVQGRHFVDAAVEMIRNNRHPTYEEVRLEANRRQRAAETGGSAEDGVTSRVGAIGGQAHDRLCKVCYREEMNMILMPCRHLAVCEICSARTVSCPICHGHVNSCLRARF